MLVIIKEQNIIEDILTYPYINQMSIVPRILCNHSGLL